MVVKKYLIMHSASYMYKNENHTPVALKMSSVQKIVILYPARINDKSTTLRHLQHVASLFQVIIENLNYFGHCIKITNAHMHASPSHASQH